MGLKPRHCAHAGAYKSKEDIGTVLSAFGIGRQLLVSQAGSATIGAVPKDQTLFYKESGKLAWSRLPPLILHEFPKAALLGLAYGVFTHYSTFVFIDAMVCWYLGTYLGNQMVGASQRANIRNSWAIALLTFLQGALAYYLALVVFLALQSGGTMILTDPRAIYAMFSLTGRLSGSSGFNLVALPYQIEFAVLVGRAAFVAKETLEDLTYCEDCACWLSPQPGEFILRGPIHSVVEARKAFQEDPMAALERMAPYDASQKTWSRLTLLGCPECGESLFLSGATGRTKFISDGSLKSTTTPFFRRLKLEPETFDLLYEKTEGDS